MKRIILPLSMLLLLSACSKNVSTLIGEEATVYDAIIVPGVPFEGEEWSKTMKLRVYWSKWLYDQGVAKNIIYSGSAVYTPYTEARIMAEYAKELGIPEEHIFTECRAEHSTENVYYSMQIAKREGFDEVALATDPIQAAFLKKFAKRKKWDIACLPASVKVVHKMEKTDPEICAETAFVENFQSLPDRQGFFKRFGGTMGKEIDYAPEPVGQANNAE